MQCSSGLSSQGQAWGDAEVRGSFAERWTSTELSMELLSNRRSFTSWMMARENAAS